jgi:hypothetical protein
LTVLTVQKLLTRLGQMFGLPISNFGGAQWHHRPLPNLLVRASPV